jgi:hypothetical protein
MRAKEYGGMGLHRAEFFLARATRFPRRMNSIGFIAICWNPSRQNR